MKLFIIDDSLMIYEGLNTLLSGLKDVEIVGRAGTEREAVEFIERLRPDVVILDIRLQSGNGIDVLRKIKTPGEPSPVIIVLTNYPYPQYRKKCLALGAEYFLDKVTEIEKLPDIFQRLARQGKSLS